MREVCLCELRPDFSFILSGMRHLADARANIFVIKRKRSGFPLIGGIKSLMAMSSTLAIALFLSTKMNRASQAIDKFASKTANRLAQMAAKSEELMRKDFVDLEVGKAITRPVTNLMDAAVSYQLFKN